MESSKNKIDRRQRLFVLIAITAALVSLNGAPPASASESNFISALYNVLTYAQKELGHDFATDGCPRCEVRVVLPQTLEQYVDPVASGFTGRTLQQIRDLIEENESRALVVTNIVDRRGGGEKTVNLAFLPVATGSFPGFGDANGVLISDNTVPGCGFRSFGQKGSQHFCASCAIGLCCGACKCNACGGDLTAARQGLGLPGPLDDLFDGSTDFEDYELDVDLVDD